MTDLMPRATIDQIDGYRRQAIDLYDQAFQLVKEAQKVAALAAPGGVYDLPHLATRNHPGARDCKDFADMVRKPLDRSIWEYLLRSTKLDTLMDKTAKDEFRDQLKDDPPPATADNCQATLERLLGDSGMIFRRSIATAFAKLDRRFRSHDGFKVGARIVLTWFADGNGYVGAHRGRDTLVDVERTFHVLDRQPVPSVDAGVVGALGLASYGLGYGPKAYEAETAYFRVRVFKNGNAHVWFKRNDLVEKVNLLLAEYYGEALAAGHDAAQADVTPEPGRHMAKNYGAFWSPPAVVDKLLEAAGLHKSTSRWTPTTYTVLEPSAGIGFIAREVIYRGSNVDCVEIQPQHADHLRSVLPAASRVLNENFLDLSPARIGLYDRVIMNPPFDRGLDVDHVNHAMKFLTPGGVLVAVMAAGVEFREDRKTVTFRDMVARHGGEFTDLPPGSFQDSGTMVNTCIVRIKAPG